jgi:hypothetical protein
MKTAIFNKITKKKLVEMNQNIFVTDIFVIQKKPPENMKSNFVGELSHTENRSNHFERIIDYIKLLVFMADEYHSQSNYEDKKLKKGHENNITRILTNEHFFFPHPQAGPFCEADFLKLIAELEQITKQCHSNVFFIGSLPLLGRNNEIYNLTIHIQCGECPKIDVIAKATAARFDPTYGFKKATFNYRKEEYTHSVFRRNNPLGKEVFSLLAEPTKELMSAKNSIAINYDGIIYCQLENSAFITSVESCLDHFQCVAIENLKRALTQNTNLIPSFTKFMPKRIAQTVLANGLVDNKNKVAYADPWNISFANLNHKIMSNFINEIDLKKILTRANLETASWQKYPEMKIQGEKLKKPDTKEEIDAPIIFCPPFGKEVNLLIYQKYELPFFNQSLLALIDDHNSRVDKFLASNIMTNLPAINHLGKIIKFLYKNYPNANIKNICKKVAMFNIEIHRQCAEMIGESKVMTMPISEILDPLPHLQEILATLKHMNAFSDHEQLALSIVYLGFLATEIKNYEQTTSFPENYDRTNFISSNYSENFRKYIKNVGLPFSERNNTWLFTLDFKQNEQEVLAKLDQLFLNLEFFTIDDLFLMVIEFKNLARFSDVGNYFPWLAYFKKTLDPFISKLEHSINAIEEYQVYDNQHNLSR